MTVDNDNADGSMPAQDAIVRMKNVSLGPDEYAIVGERHVNDKKHGMYVYPCGAVDVSDVVCPNVKLGETTDSKGP
jgi:hypothetical protein